MNAHNTTLEMLDQQIRERSILQHPFYVAWARGELTKEQLATYAKIYYPHVAAFPRYLESALETTKDARVRDELSSNLADELANPKAHNELWLDFAASLGLDRVAVEKATPESAAKNTVSTFNRLASKSAASALAALYAYESQQPDVAREKIKGLGERYGLNNADALGYFEVHAEADVLHRAGERNAMLHCLQNGASEEEMTQATNDALDAYWGLLDGISREAGVSLVC